jgi:hypothetical protein
VREVFDCGAGAGVGAATPNAFWTGRSFVSDAVRSCSARGVGVLRGFGLSSSFRADFDFAVFFVWPDVSFARDFFFRIFGLGVGVWRRFTFLEAPGVGVLCGLAAGVVSSSEPDFSVGEASLVNFALLAAGVFRGVAEGRCFLVNF